MEMDKGMHRLKKFWTELNVNGMLAMAAILSMIVGGTVYSVETRALAEQAKIDAAKAQVTSDAAATALVTAASKLAEQRSRDEAISQKHFDKLDSAVEMIAAVMSERTGKPVTFPSLDDSSDPQSSNASPPPSNDP